MLNSQVILSVPSAPSPELSGMSLGMLPCLLCPRGFSAPLGGWGPPAYSTPALPPAEVSRLRKLLLKGSGCYRLEVHRPGSSDGRTSGAPAPLILSQLTPALLCCSMKKMN